MNTVARDFVPRTERAGRWNTSSVQKDPPPTSATCNRTPRYRTCYASGFGRGFSRTYRQILPKNQTLNKAEDVLKLIFTEELTAFAYPGKKTAVDVSYDEILTGKLMHLPACGTESCLRLYEQRDHNVHMMLGEFGKREIFLSKNESKITSLMAGAVDLHLNKNVWPHMAPPSPNILPVLDILAEECRIICRHLLLQDGFELESEKMCVTGHCLMPF